MKLKNLDKRLRKSTGYCTDNTDLHNKQGNETQVRKHANGMEHRMSGND